jgi:hypothetical protein
VKALTIDQAFDSRLLGAALGSPDTWRVWLVALRAAFGLPLDDSERETFQVIAGDRVPPSRRVRELWCVIVPMPKLDDIVQRVALTGQDDVIAAFGEIGKAAEDAAKRLAQSLFLADIRPRGQVFSGETAQGPSLYLRDNGSEPHNLL